MKIGFAVCIVLMAMVIAALLIKIYLLKKSAKEIEAAFTDRLQASTNTLIDISSRDKSMRRLADTINGQLRRLRTERHRFLQGDRELKSAVTNLSHDLRTPLTAICGYLDLLEQEEKTESAARYIQVMKERAESMQVLTEELFRYSTILDQEKPMVSEPVTINRALEESVAAFYTELKKYNIRPDVRMPEEPVIRTLDRSCLSRVFSNLISNAMKYSNGDLEIFLYETGEIVFANQASGLDAVQVGKLFDRFFTVEAARKSTGLGLAISRTLVEQMGGTISAEYEKGRLCVRILFPDVGLCLSGCAGEQHRIQDDRPGDHQKIPNKGSGEGFPDQGL